MSNIYSFPPLASPAAQRLILGSMPGKASLSAQQYYAHPRNHFWRFMALILGVPESESYEERCHALLATQTALWDVLKVCTRSSSLDSDIDESSIVANDFGTFLSAHPGIKCIYFNGAKAESVYRRYVRPCLSPQLACIETQRLPSTSPANAGIPFETKLQQWQVITRSA
tara:strand:+ start:3520 stop:4029 length:510 start_codon:yes stop_codon:yes gene_type:complete